MATLPENLQIIGRRSRSCILRSAKNLKVKGVFADALLAVFTLAFIASLVITASLIFIRPGKTTSSGPQDCNAESCLEEDQGLLSSDVELEMAKIDRAHVPMK